MLTVLLYSNFADIASYIIYFHMANGGVMKPTYILKEIQIQSEDRKKDGLEFVVSEGDVILDKGFRFEVLPAKRDFTKPITRKKITNSPQEKSERLFRIKELGEESAAVAILDQETYFEDNDTLVRKETESLITLKYGQKFTVYSKEQVYDSPFSINYSFIIENESKQQEQKVQKFCTECGVKLIKGDKFCRECGTPVLSEKH